MSDATETMLDTFPAGAQERPRRWAERARSFRAAAATATGQFVDRIGDATAKAILKTGQQQFAMGKLILQRDYLSPEEIGFADFKQRLISSHYPEYNLETPIGLWLKPREASDKPEADVPVYVMFHGRSGHWGYCGDTRAKVEEGFDPGYRLKWLRTMAATGAEIIAVHTRGHGLSARDNMPLEVEFSDSAFKRDAKAIAHYLLKDREIDPKRIVIVGESLGGAQAVMLGEAMLEMGAKPRGICTVATFSSMVEAVLPYVKEKTIAGWQLGKHMTTQDVAECLDPKIHLNTLERLQAFKGSGVAFRFIHPREDQRVGFDHAERLHRKAKELGLDSEIIALGRGGMMRDGKHPHTDWSPIVVAKVAEKLFRQTGISPKIAASGGGATGRIIESFER